MKNNIRIRTLTQGDIRRLALFRQGGKWAASFYLGIRAGRDFRSVANSALSEEENRAKGEGIFSKAEIARIHQAFSKVGEILDLMRLPDRTRTLVFFFTDRGVFRAYKLPVYIPTQIVMEKDFYVHPSVKSLDKYPRYAVLFLQRDRARIFDLFWGEIEDRTVEIRSEVPQRMNAARTANRGVDERKVRGHIEVHINRHLEKVAGAVEKFMSKERIPYLVIGSRKELIERFREFLPREMRKKVVGSYLTRADQDVSEIKKRSLEVIGDFEREQEDELADIFLEEAGKKVKGAIAGAENVLGYLRDYQVRTLVIGKDYREAGYVCEDGHHPFLRRGPCPACEGSAISVGDIADEIIEEAVRQKAQIVHFAFPHPDFDRFGIGAILK